MVGCPYPWWVDPLSRLCWLLSILNCLAMHMLELTDCINNHFSKERLQFYAVKSEPKKNLEATEQANRETSTGMTLPISFYLRLFNNVSLRKHFQVKQYT